MFTGNMVTEAIPTRVYSLYRIATSKKDVTRTEAQTRMEPPEIYGGSSSYFSKVLKAATELKLLDVQDNVLIPLVLKEQLKDIVNMNEEIYKYAVSDAYMLKLLTDRLGTQISNQMALGWRFWAQFLGFGYMNNTSFLPNAYVFVKDVLELLNLEKNKDYQIDEFMHLFEQYGEILSGNLQPERNMNIALSSALRQLHDNKEIELKYRSDAESRWILYPSMEQFNDQIASIVYKGVKK